MAVVWSRHPAYTLLVAVALLTTLYLLVPHDVEPGSWASERELERRLRRSAIIYDRALENRRALIEKFGPAQEEIALFPPNRAPWPPYTVWDFFPAAFNCPHEIERIGVLGDGGKWTCGLSRLEHRKDCIVYSFGINNESSFEAEILERTNHCQIWGYDFSVPSFGPEIHLSLANRTHFSDVGLAGEDQPGGNPPMYRLETLMKLNNHTHIDILKMDIEGWEFESLRTFILPYVESGEALPIGQLQVEIHIWDKTFPEFLEWWTLLEASGLRPFWTEPNLVYQNYDPKGTKTADLAEYSFLNVKGTNVFIN
ncbi:hypothetical protein CC1G_02225 [Coprinopsis cinerea okayama7|uniref:Methyltransferase domain-containing protein n=1 Tax=Coprinopsis cinerea (strain Okayama-7 / 130 / ATCC MYA-4618 / FGSC 9003) TaxID=240176 RepID=A8NKM0_COPC7|nr:hypothetical protein CC1G_02225 [Coprinopsis cinerea okayama7\|eukprot:XP_001834489.2 hypothetical protein CC1G_02225 [Coprinopsis cinerea okayama7\